MKLLTVAAALVSWVAQTAFADADCKPVFARQQDGLVTDGCPSPVGFCAGGTIRGNQGLHGTSFFSALGVHPIPDDPLTRQAVPGISTYTTDEGVLTISDVSVFDVVRGTFAGVVQIAEGTGRFAGASGDIFTFGRVTPDGTSFRTTVTGELCVPQ